MSEIDDLEAYETPQGRSRFTRKPKGLARTKAQERALRRARWQKRYDTDPEYREHYNKQKRDWYRAKHGLPVGEAC